MSDPDQILKAARARAREKGLPYEGALLPAEANALREMHPGTRLVDVRSRAFFTDFRDGLDRLRDALVGHADAVARRLRRDGVAGDVVRIKLKTSEKLARPVDRLMAEFSSRGIRVVGLFAAAWWQAVDAAKHGLGHAELLDARVCGVEVGVFGAPEPLGDGHRGVVGGNERGRGDHVQDAARHRLHFGGVGHEALGACS